MLLRLLFVIAGFVLLLSAGLGPLLKQHQETASTIPIPVRTVDTREPSIDDLIRQFEKPAPPHPLPPGAVN
jgi:hypothetical protein